MRSSPVMRFFGAVMRVWRDECDSKGCRRASRLGRLRPFCPPFNALLCRDRRSEPVGRAAAGLCRNQWAL